MPRRLFLLALVAGVLLGGVAALVVPRSPARSAAVEAPLRFGPPARPAGGVDRTVLRAEPGSVRIGLRAADPAGGPRWAVRRFAAREERGGPRRGGRRLECLQLGREAGGRFGWIDGTNTFRPVGVAFEGSPLACDFERLDGSRLEVATLVAGATGPTPQVRRTVAGGTMSRRGRAIELRVAGRPVRPRRSGRRFLAFLPAQVGRREIGATVTEAGGRRRALGIPDPDREAVERGLGPRVPRPLPRPLRVDAQAPDPAGGPSWGLGTVPSTTGTVCVSEPARVVGERVGTVRFDLGTFTDAFVNPGRCRPPGGPSRRRPLDVTYVIGGGDTLETAREPDFGRVERRTQRGQTIVAGTARPEVRLVTIATPRDVRSLAPSPGAGAFLAVYDGTFPTGEIALTAHFADGSSRVVERFELGGL